MERLGGSGLARLLPLREKNLIQEKININPFRRSWGNSEYLPNFRWKLKLTNDFGGDLKYFALANSGLWDKSMEEGGKAPFNCPHFWSKTKCRCCAMVFTIFGVFHDTWSHKSVLYQRLCQMCPTDETFPSGSPILDFIDIKSILLWFIEFLVNYLPP